LRIARRRDGARGQLRSPGRFDSPKIHTASLARAAIPKVFGLTGFPDRGRLALRPQAFGAGTPITGLGLPGEEIDALVAAKVARQLED